MSTTHTFHLACRIQTVYFSVQRTQIKLCIFSRCCTPQKLNSPWGDRVILSPIVPGERRFLTSKLTHGRPQVMPEEAGESLWASDPLGQVQSLSREGREPCYWPSSALGVPKGRRSQKGGLHFDVSQTGQLTHIPFFLLDTPDIVSPPSTPATHTPGAQEATGLALPNELWVEVPAWLVIQIATIPFPDTSLEANLYDKGTLGLESPNESRLSRSELDTLCEQETGILCKQAFLGLFTAMNTAID